MLRGGGNTDRGTRRDRGACSDHRTGKADGCADDCANRGADHRGNRRTNGRPGGGRHDRANRGADCSGGREYRESRRQSQCDRQLGGERAG